jgi:hypothetical protein
MVSYTCKKCNRVYNHKSNYTRHCNKKNPCKLTVKTNGPNKVVVSNIICSICCKVFTSKSILIEHLNNNCELDNKLTDLHNENQQKQSVNKKHIVETVLEDNKNDFPQFYHNSTVISHNLPQNSAKIPQNPTKTFSFECNFCNKQLSRKDSLMRHLDICKVKSNIEASKEKVFIKLLKEVKELKTQINNNTNTNNTNMNNTNTNTHSNNTNNISQTNNIKLVAFGKEDLSYISENITKKLLKKGFQSVPVLIDHVHFNKNNPSMQNVYIPNLKNPYAMTYNGERWQLTDLQDTIKSIYDEKKCYLEEEFERLEDILDKITVKKFDRFLTEDEGLFIKDMFQQIKLLLYNKRDMPLDTHKNIK